MAVDLCYSFTDGEFSNSSGDCSACPDTCIDDQGYGFCTGMQQMYTNQMFTTEALSHCCLHGDSVFFFFFFGIVITVVKTLLDDNIAKNNN